MPRSVVLPGHEGLKFHYYECNSRLRGFLMFIYDMNMVVQNWNDAISSHWKAT